jgi:two-component system CheB/CheR fusion protein
MKPPSTTGEPRHILIIEDNRDLAESLRLLLAMRGYAVRVAYNGLEGVKAAHEWHPDTVLCDIGLPGLNGYDVAAEVRRDPAIAQACLVAITGYGTDQDRERAHQAGFDHHFTKPADPVALLQLIARDRGNAS